MNRTKCFILAVVLGCLITPVIGMASPVHYTAVGSGIDDTGTILPIIGEMYIDDQLRDWETGQPTEVRDELGLYLYRYNITDFSLKVGEYSFSGAGALTMAGVRGPTPADLFWYPDDWSLSGDADGTPWHWSGFPSYFYNVDGTRATDYSSLADIIELAPAGSDPPFLWLAKNNNSAPVPEPSTMTLLGASLVGFAIRRKNRRRQL